MRSRFLFLETKIHSTLNLIPIRRNANIYLLEEVLCCNKLAPPPRGPSKLDVKKVREFRKGPPVKRTNRRSNVVSCAEKMCVTVTVLKMRVSKVNVRKISVTRIRSASCASACLFRSRKIVLSFDPREM